MRLAGAVSTAHDPPVVRGEIVVLSDRDAARRSGREPMRRHAAERAVALVVQGEARRERAAARAAAP